MKGNNVRGNMCLRSSLYDTQLTTANPGADQIPTRTRRDHRHCEGATSKPPGWVPGRTRRPEPWRPRRKGRRSGRPWERPGSRARKGKRIKAALWCGTFKNDRHTMIPSPTEDIPRALLSDRGRSMLLQSTFATRVQAVEVETEPGAWPRAVRPKQTPARAGRRRVLLGYEFDCATAVPKHSLKHHSDSVNALSRIWE